MIEIIISPQLPLFQLFALVLLSGLAAADHSAPPAPYHPPAPAPYHPPPPAPYHAPAPAYHQPAPYHPPAPKYHPEPYHEEPVSQHTYVISLLKQHTHHHSLRWRLYPMPTSLRNFSLFLRRRQKVKFGSKWRVCLPSRQSSVLLRA